MLLHSSSSDHRKTTYFRSVWDLGHLNLLTMVVKVVGRGFSYSSDAFDPEKAAHCSEIIRNPFEPERITILESRRHAFSRHYLSTVGVPTLGASGTRLAWTSSPRRSSGSSGRGSASARMGLVQKKNRFARKPLMKTH